MHEFVMCLCTDVVAILEEQPGCVTLLNESPMVRRCRVRAGNIIDPSHSRYYLHCLARSYELSRTYAQPLILVHSQDIIEYWHRIDSFRLFCCITHAQPIVVLVGIRGNNRLCFCHTITTTPIYHITRDRVHEVDITCF
ncbi:predicted protein [Lichtheimia corymbifera JMRC:FSU:9682]|uniref:Uncharacterized protein n=1 Tax=Lichtheimia corymbifera JMRC:FSU:9682 TaxID=1263082 RepID=A0A068RTS1_9FUNG|nr:predicted protein [Lichtheimia corymbifera JMRC:FSU:9682]